MIRLTLNCSLTSTLSPRPIATAINRFDVDNITELTIVTIEIILPITENKPKWQDFIKNNTSKTTKGILMDTDIVLSSDDIMVIKTDLEENAQLINDKLSEISEDFKKYSKLDYLFIAVYDEYWKSKTEEYKENKDKGIKYKILEEPKIETQSKILDDVFSMNKVEIK